MPNRSPSTWYSYLTSLFGSLKRVCGRLLSLLYDLCESTESAEMPTSMASLALNDAAAALKVWDSMLQPGVLFLG